MSGLGAFALAMALLALMLNVARAENLIATLGNDRIAIRSNFTGGVISVFGVIERDPAVARSGAYDAVVSVRGPRGAVSVWEKQRLGPLWLNLDQRKYIAIPALISVRSNRRLADIASDERREEWRLGVANLIPEQSRARRADDPRFRESLERIRRKQGLFFDDQAGIRFLTPTIFQTRVEIPGHAPLGPYDVDIAVLTDGDLVARQSLNFTVVKSGFEAAVAVIAREEATLYGVFTALFAVAMGCFATIVFDRR